MLKARSVRCFSSALAGVLIAILYSVFVLYKQTAKQSPVSLDGGDFGEVIETDEFVWPIKIQNHTNDTLVIDHFVASCACASVSPRQLIIEPRTFATCRLEMDLTKLCGNKDNREKKKVQVDLVPVITRPSLGPDVRLPITGVVVPVLALEPASITFGAVFEGHALANKVQITSSVLLESLDAVCHAKGWSCTVSKTGASTFELLLVTNEYISPGPLAFQLSLVPKNATLSKSLRYSVPVNGLVVSEFTASPPALLLGRRKIGTTYHENVVLASRDGKPCQVTHITCALPDTAVCPLGAVSRSAKEFKIDQVALYAGKQTGHVTFQLTNQDGMRRTLVLPIEYYGVP
jgi:hypothetical protein